MSDWRWRRPLSIRWTLELFQRQRWGDGVERIRLFRAHRYHLELNWTEPNREIDTNRIFHSICDPVRNRRLKVAKIRLWVLTFCAQQSVSVTLWNEYVTSLIKNQPTRLLSQNHKFEAKKSGASVEYILPKPPKLMEPAGGKMCTFSTSSEQVTKTTI